MSETNSVWSKILDFLKQRWFSIVLLILAIAFIAQNQQDGVIQLLGVTMVAPMWLTLTVILLVGFIIGITYTKRRNKKRD